MNYEVCPVCVFFVFFRWGGGLCLRGELHNSGRVIFSEKKEKNCTINMRNYSCLIDLLDSL